MHAIHGADPRLTARVVECGADNAANGRVGRRLPALFVGAGIPEPSIATETFTIRDAGRAALPPITIMAAVARQSGTLSAAEAEDWLTQLGNAGTRGEFFWAATMFAVSGQRH